MIVGALGQTMGPLEADSIGPRSFLEPKLLPMHRNLEIRSIDGRIKKFSRQAMGRALSRLFLQPRYV